MVPVMMFAQLNLRNVLACDVRNQQSHAVYRNMRFAAMGRGFVGIAANILWQGHGEHPA